MKPRMSLEETAELLELAEELKGSLEYGMLAQLLKMLPGEILLAQPELGVLLCESLWEIGDDEAALRLAIRLRDPCSRRSDHLARRRSNLEGILHFLRGELEEAQDLFLEVLHEGGVSLDQVAIGHGSMHLGMIAHLRRDWDNAISAFSRALGAYQKAAQRRALAACHHNLGYAFREMGRFEESVTHFEHSHALYQGISNQRDLIGLELERSLVFNALRDDELAEATVRRAMTRLSVIKHQRLRGEAFRVLGIIKRTQGDIHTARRCFRLSRAIAEKTSNRLLVAESNQELAIAESLSGEDAAATAAAEEAARIYLEMRLDKRAQSVSDCFSKISLEQGESLC